MNQGAKGPRWYDWALVQLAWLLVRGSLEAPEKVAAYLVFAPEGTLLETMVAVAGPR